jgi:hypothetical protein
MHDHYPRITELSGPVSDGWHWYGINDGDTKIEVFVFGRDCCVQKVIASSTDPFDVDDLARSPDATVWLSDTGDNNKGLADRRAARRDVTGRTGQRGEPLVS